MRLTCRFTWVAVAIVSICFLSHAQAIVLADKSTRNKSAPTGSIASSGWQWQGDWGAFVGTPIGKDYFITASHVGGSVGQSLTLNGKSYKTVAMYDDPNSDLRIWKTSTSFSSFAPLYTSSSEVGKTAVLFGRGATRGSAVTVDGSTHGWLWGTQDGALSWGENKIKSTINGGSGIGSVLSYSFDRSGHGDHVSNEGTTSAGDSSGGIFIKSGTKWELAALNYSVDGPFSVNGGASFMASIYDKGGMSDAGVFTSDGSTDVPANAFATRISTNQSWINSVLSGKASATALGSPVPEPGVLRCMVMGGSLLTRRRAGFRVTKVTPPLL